LRQLFLRLRLPIDILQGQESRCSQWKVRGRHAKEFSKKKLGMLPKAESEDDGHKRDDSKDDDFKNAPFLLTLWLSGTLTARFFSIFGFVRGCRSGWCFRSH
jgi:hypothetical protein